MSTITPPHPPIGNTPPDTVKTLLKGDTLTSDQKLQAGTLMME